MVWTIEFSDAAIQQLSKLDKPVARRIVGYMEQRIACLNDPRTLGEALKGPRLGDFWKYRVWAIGGLFATSKIGVSWCRWCELATAARCIETSQVGVGRVSLANARHF